MKSDTITIQQLFQDRRQYRVPFYQRAYVWNKEDQWERLWKDIQSQAENRFHDNQLVPHFLGAVVLEPQLRKGVLGVETFNIIDGQHRLTTLQYVFAALAITLRANRMSALLSLLEECQWNRNRETMLEPSMEVFKVWPTFCDRVSHQMAMTARDVES